MRYVMPSEWPTFRDRQFLPAQNSVVAIRNAMSTYADQNTIVLAHDKIYIGTVHADTSWPSSMP
jgi:hypothetical protein